MDKGLIRRRFARAASTYSERADAQRRIAEQMTRLIVRYVPRSAYRNVLEVGCGTGVFTRMLLHRTHPSRLWLNDICPEMENRLTGCGEELAFLWNRTVRKIRAIPRKARRRIR